MTRLRLFLLLAIAVCVSHAQTSNNNNNANESRQPQAQPQQQRSIWDEPIRFSTKAKDSCTMVVSGAGDYTRLRVSCKGQTPGQSYYCDFQGKPNLCRPYNLNPRHYFTQMMWDLRKLNNACQGQKVYRPAMCKKYPDEAHMTYLSAYPKPATAKPSKPVQEPRKPVVPAVQPRPVTTPKPVKPQPQPVRPQPGKTSQPKKTTPKPAKTTTRPTEQTDNKASRLATEYCWRSFHGICTYFISWFQN